MPPFHNRPRRDSAPRRMPVRWLRWGIAGLLLVLTQVTGCSRAFWRTQADADVYQAVGELLTDPRWAVPRLDITPDPRSRFFDPFDPDHSPLPPDDAAAHALMHCVDGKEGYRGWHKFGDIMNVDNPGWLAQFGITPDMIDPETGAYSGVVPALEEITLAEAVELSLIHSRDYQTQLESVYLTALDVTFERFQFGIRYLGIGGGEPSSNTLYSLRPEGRQDSLGFNNRFGVSQLLPAGGQIALELANNTIWLFAPDSTSSASALSYSLVQPLFLGAGRKIVLENLTQVERLLLYSLRDLARFRQDFFVDVVGSGGGYLGLLQQLQAIRNQEDNIRRLERQVVELQTISSRPDIPPRVPLETFPPGLQIPEVLQEQLEFNALDGELIWRGPMTEAQEQALRNLGTDPALRGAVNELIETIRVVPASLDVLQLQSQLTDAQNTLRDQRRALQDSLDSYKLLLGLPTDMPIGIDDGLLKQFQFIAPDLRDLEAKVEGFVLDWSRISEDDPEPDLLLSTLTRYMPLAKEVEVGGVALLDSDLSRVRGSLEERLGSLPSDAERDRVRADIGGDLRRLENARSRLTTNLDRAKQLIDWVGTNPGATLEQRQQVHKDIKRLQEDLLQIVRGLTVTQIGLRLELVAVQPFDMPIEKTVAIGLENRVDLMNTRAVVMDARRQVEVAANRLMSRIDLVAQGDVRNRGRENPVDFRLDQSEFRFGVQFTAPLDQIQERNAYRAALIIYQRARRDYMQAEDQVKQQVRQAWRQLDILKANLETSRQAVRIAALQLDSAIEEANAPTTGEVNTGGLQGQNLLRALDAVLRAQNSLLGNWVRYEQNRLNIYRDMGIMEIGPDGLWTDDFYQGARNENAVPGSSAAGAVRIGPHADAVGGDGPRLDPPGGDGIVPMGYRQELDGRGGRAGVVSLATGPGSEGPVPGERGGPGAGGQPEELRPDQQGRGHDDDHLDRPGGDVGQVGGSGLRTRLFGPGG
jgi:hypothetical protein